MTALLSPSNVLSLSSSFFKGRIQFDDGTALPIHCTVTIFQFFKGRIQFDDGIALPIHCRK